MQPHTGKQLTPYTWLFIAILLRAINQVLMKLLALDWGNPGQELAVALMTGAIVLVLLARAYSWQKALVHLPLSVAYPFFALTLITLMASGHCIFSEQISQMNLLGSCLIVAGISVIASGHGR